MCCGEKFNNGFLEKFGRETFHTVLVILILASNIDVLGGWGVRF